MVKKELNYKVSSDRKVVLLRGMPGVGKTTFVKEHNLEGHVISQDTLRGQLLNPVLSEEGIYVVNNNQNKVVFQIFMKQLAKKFSLGGLVVVDNLNLTVSNIKTISQLADDYGYELSVINFEADLDLVLERNEGRYLRQDKNYFSDISKLKGMYETYIQNTESVKKKYPFIDSKDSKGVKELFTNQYKNLDDYNQIKVIGDIHGSYTVLKEAIPRIEDDTFYIFLGDYVDRGIENHEVVMLLKAISSKPNVVLLEGNHEIHLRGYVNNYDLGYGREFKQFTRKEFEEKRTSKKDIRQLLNRLRTHFLFEFKGNKYVCTHGGILPTDIVKLSQEQRISGIGGYSFDIDAKWEELTETTNLTQFHGHRNKMGILPEQYKRSFNLENGVDSGGYLRVATITDKVEVKEYKNDKIRGEDREKIQQMEVISYVEDVIVNDKGSAVKLDLNGVETTSIRFSRKYLMNYGTRVKGAIRGLFIGSNNKILVRGYDKFYNHDEYEDIETLESEFNFPITAYKKENGFLGLVSYSNVVGGFIYATKSLAITDNSQETEDNHYSMLLRKMFKESFNTKQQKLIKEFLLMNKSTLTFEVISSKDKHITLETMDKLVILDSIKNTIRYETLPYSKLLKFTDKLGLLGTVHVKSKSLELKTIEDFKQYVLSDKKNMRLRTEGEVFSDVKGKVFKYKTLHYLYWKEVRNTLNRVKRRKQTSDYMITYMNNFLDWHNLRDTGYNSESYIKDTFKVLPYIYDNIEDFKYSSLVKEHGDVDIPKVINYVEDRIN